MKRTQDAQAKMLWLFVFLTRCMHIGIARPTQVEEAMFETHLARRASNTKRLRNARAKTCLRCCFRAFVARGSSENRRKSNRKSTKIQPKSIPSRRKIDFGPFWAVKAVSRPSQKALGTGPGRQKKAPGPILGRPGRAKSTREPAKSLPGPLLGRSRTTPGRSPSALGAPSAVEHARGTILRCFCRVAQKLEA